MNLTDASDLMIMEKKIGNHKRILSLTLIEIIAKSLYPIDRKAIRLVLAARHSIGDTGNKYKALEETWP